MGKIARSVLGALGAESIQSFDDGQYTRRSLEQECRESGAVVVLFKRRDEQEPPAGTVH